MYLSINPWMRDDERNNVNYIGGELSLDDDELEHLETSREQKIRCI